MHTAMTQYKIAAQVVTVSIRGLAAYASFGHPEQFFDSLDTRKFMSEFGDDDFS